MDFHFLRNTEYKAKHAYLQQTEAHVLGGYPVIDSARKAQKLIVTVEQDVLRDDGMCRGVGRNFSRGGRFKC